MNVAGDNEIDFRDVFDIDSDDNDRDVDPEIKEWLEQVRREARENGDDEKDELLENIRKRVTREREEALRETHERYDRAMKPIRKDW